MAGQILFTWMQGSDLDHNCKKWRLFADIANDAAMCLELTGPLWPPSSIQGVLCVAGVSRALVGVAGGATRTAITQHQARKDNISDVAAKDGSQETLVNLSALLLNLMILPWIAGDPTWTWSLFVILTMLHLYANYKAVTSLVFETLNKERLLRVLDSYYQRNKGVPSPADVNKKENVIVGFGLHEQAVCRSTINMGVSLKPYLKSEADLAALRRKFEDEDAKYVILPSSGKSSEIDIGLRSDYDSKDVLAAFCHAFHQSIFGEKKPLFNFEALEADLNRAGWVTTHAQIATLGWKGSLRTSS